MINPLLMLSDIRADETVMSRLYGHYFGHQISAGTRIFIIIGLAFLAHVAVQAIRYISEWMIYKSHAQKNPLGRVVQRPKLVTVARLCVSGMIFVIYFFALGLILQEIGVNLTAYLASASVVGLAISFGSQGLVQDVVIGLTVIFWDAMDVGDMVEIVGTATVIGRVDEIGLRFTKLVNFYNQEVFIPNRTIANVSRFPHGGIDAYADAQVPAGAEEPKAVEAVAAIAKGMWAQFGGIILSEPMIGIVETAPGGGWNFFRIHFKIWPGQGSLIETTFRQQVIKAMKVFDPDYADWQVPVTYRAISPPKTTTPDV